VTLLTAQPSFCFASFLLKEPAQHFYDFSSQLWQFFDLKIHISPFLFRSSLYLSPPFRDGLSDNILVSRHQGAPKPQIGYSSGPTSRRCCRCFLGLGLPQRQRGSPSQPLLVGFVVKCGEITKRDLSPMWKCSLPNVDSGPTLDLLCDIAFLYFSTLPREIHPRLLP
jgi:hypothetical protein